MFDTARITFIGELDVARRSEIRERFDDALGASRTLIDLSEASAIGSLFASEFFRFARMTDDRGGTLAIYACTPHVVKVLRLLRADEMGAIFTSEVQAMQYLAGPYASSAPRTWLPPLAAPLPGAPLGFEPLLVEQSKT